MILADKLKEARLSYEGISEKLSQPGIAGDQAEFRRLMREYSRLTPVMEKFREYLDAEKCAADAGEMLEAESDPRPAVACRRTSLKRHGRG